MLQFLDWVGRFPPYGGVWCGECYQESQCNPYPWLQGVEVKPDGIESNLLQDEKNQERYRSTRNRYHLIKVLFECDLCHFRNMNKQDPVYGCKKYKDTNIAIRRA